MPRMPDSVDDYAQRTTCVDFAYGRCNRTECLLSHSIIDVSRLLKLVGDVSSDATHRVSSNQVYFTLSYATKRLADTTGGTSEAQRDGGGQWTLRVLRRALTSSVGSTSVLLPTPAESTDLNAVDSLKTVEAEMLGSVCPVSNPPCLQPLSTTKYYGYQWLSRRNFNHTIYKNHSQQRCFQGAHCRLRHDLFDTKRIEALCNSLSSIVPQSHNGTLVPQGPYVRFSISYVCVPSDVSSRGQNDSPARASRSEFKWRVVLRTWEGQADEDYRKRTVMHGDFIKAIEGLERKVLPEHTVEAGRPAPLRQNFHMGPIRAAVAVRPQSCLRNSH